MSSSVRSLLEIISSTSSGFIEVILQDVASYQRMLNRKDENGQLLVKSIPLRFVVKLLTRHHCKQLLLDPMFVTTFVTQGFLSRLQDFLRSFISYNKYAKPLFTLRLSTTLSKTKY